MGGFDPNRPKQNMHAKRAQRGDKEGHPKEHADISNINNWAPKERTRRNQRGKPEETPTKEQHTEPKLHGKRKKLKQQRQTCAAKKAFEKGKQQKQLEYSTESKTLLIVEMECEH